MKRLPIWVVSFALFVVQYLLVTAHVGLDRVRTDQALVPLMTLVSVLTMGFFSKSKDLSDLIAWCRGSKRIFSWWILNCVMLLVLIAWRIQSGGMPYLFAVPMFILVAALLGGGLVLGAWVLERVSALCIWTWEKIRRLLSA